MFPALSYFALSLLLGLAGLWFQQHRALAGRAVRHDGFFSRLATAGWALWFYWYKAVWPLHLTFAYPQWHVDPLSPTAYVPGLLLVAGGLMCWRYRRSWGGPLLAGLGYFAITIFPALGFVNVGQFTFSLVADHYQYQSLIGLIALSVGGAAWALKRWGSGVAEWAGYAAAAGLLLVLLLLSRQQTHIWTNSETLWRDVISKTPSVAVAYVNLGNAVRISEPVLAASLYREAIQRNPRLAEAHNNLGALLEKSSPDEALQHYALALDIDPAYIDAHNNLGVFRARRGQLDQAIAEFNAALGLDPNHTVARRNLEAACRLQQRGGKH